MKASNTSMSFRLVYDSVVGRSVGTAPAEPGGLFTFRYVWGLRLGGTRPVVFVQFVRYEGSGETRSRRGAYSIFLSPGPGLDNSTGNSRPST